MTTLRWIITGLAILFFVGCFSCTLAVAIRWIRTGKTGSGCPVVGSIVAAAGIMVAPGGTMFERIGIAFIPFGLEMLEFAVVTIIGKKTGRSSNQTPHSTAGGRSDAPRGSP